mmetsp:Transcript_12208/g.29141  ORF Transcript_12208/g.29141 Transcript_12208/m.29141 type:complete len:346 (-) Transcript_12208:327-1364(-)|eukprot:CAMPEP_0177697086 /NCGR_PEP_ID=MMETSP0484_2-20121128/4327_1 /TAXON_ID=354590 /ORGANISM="Rhodomonas lens, Strain RHODO" /LENGTH=345 /DNA_ID=CAMNT_0019208103 /DNA_START=124 /DNA_END=1161 /DNA_ORIENTATION=+
MLLRGLFSRNSHAEYFAHGLNFAIGAALLACFVANFDVFQKRTIAAETDYYVRMQRVTFWTFVVVLMASAQALLFCNTQGKNFFERYQSTPGWQLSCAAFFCGFAALGIYAIILAGEGQISLDDPDMLPNMTYSKQLPTAPLRSTFKVSFWVHVIGNILPMLMVPLQFIPQLRHWRQFLFHRWVGRTLVATGLLSMAAAQVLLVIEFYIQNKYGLELWSIDWWLLQIGMELLLVGTTSCLACGFYYAVKRDIPRHAEWMHRLVAFWFAGPISRTFLQAATEWGTEVMGYGPWTWFSFFLDYVPSVIVMEIYIQKSGRFQAMRSKQLTITEGDQREDEKEPLLGRV